MREVLQKTNLHLIILHIKVFVVLYYFHLPKNFFCLPGSIFFFFPGICIFLPRIQVSQFRLEQNKKKTLSTWKKIKIKSLIFNPDASGFQKYLRYDSTSQFTVHVLILNFCLYIVSVDF